jgi:hypothetical protein
MATRSFIGMTKEGTQGTLEIQYIYCHWDGYPSNNGKILLEHYQDPEKIESLLKLGDISFLRPNVSPVGEHSYDSPEDDVVVAYHRDRGEELKSYVAYSEGQFVRRGCMVDYLYLFKEGRWHYSRGGSFVPLEL